MICLLSSIICLCCLLVFNLSVCTKPGEWPVIFLFARGRHFIPFNDISIGFWKYSDSAFCFFFVLVSLFFWPLYCLSFDLRLLNTTFAANKEATEPRIPSWWLSWSHHFFCGRHHDVLVNRYGTYYVSQMTTDMFHLWWTLSSHFLIHDLSQGL